MIHCCAIYIHVVDTLQYNSEFKAPGCAKHRPSLIWECIALEEKTKKHVHFNSDAFPRGKMPRLNWSLHMFAIQQPSRALKWIDVKRNKFFKKSLAPLLMLENSTDPSNLREITLTGETHTHTHTSQIRKYAREAPATQLSLKEAENTANLQFKVKLGQRPVNLKLFLCLMSAKISS